MFPGGVKQPWYQRECLLSQCLAVLSDAQCWFVFALVLEPAARGLWVLGYLQGLCPFVTVVWLLLSTLGSSFARLAQSPQ